MNENKTKHKRAYKGLNNINTIQESIRTTVANKSFNMTLNPVQPTLSKRDLAKMFGLSEDFTKKKLEFKKEELTPKQQMAKQFFEDNKIGLRIKELIKEFNASKDTKK